MATSEQTYADSVVTKLIYARTRLRLSQKTVGKRMSALGFNWRQQVVNAVETGTRRLQVDELLGLAIALETTLQELLSPSASDQVTLPSGESLSADFVTSSIFGMETVCSAVTWTDDKPEFGPETRRESPNALKFAEAMRSASSSRDTSIQITDGAGTVATFTWQAVKLPYGR